jgi:hypothetical protein
MAMICGNYALAVETQKGFKYGDIFSFKDEYITALDSADVEAVRQLIRLYDLASSRKDVRAHRPCIAPASTQARFRRISAKAQRATLALMQYNNAYRRAFPDVSGTEPLSRIFEYLIDPARQWDAMVMVNEGGLPIAAASGQLLEVSMGGALRRVLWNEHTWIEPQARRDGRGATIYRALEDRFLPSLVLIEIDNPFGMPTCDASETMCAPLDQDGLAASLGRMKFWSRLGFEMVSVKARCGTAIPFPCYETCQRHDKKILSDPKNRSIH